ncbi:hypothetical protein BBJ28_00015196 [Nothophytophthora sp. Chile5]|nr:hypothetical protein BBJ28_00015196 [Nothophytophthora sp. Chile5]
MRSGDLYMLRIGRRRRRSRVCVLLASLAAVAGLGAAAKSDGVMWSTRQCRQSCGAHAICGYSDTVHCLTTSEIGPLELETLVFLGLDLANATVFPTLPTSISSLRIENCVLAAVPVTALLQLPYLETLELIDNSLASTSEPLAALSEQQFAFLTSRLTGEAAAAQTNPSLTPAELSDCVSGHGGRVSRLGDWLVCVTPDASTAVARRLQSDTDASSESSQADSSMSGSSASDDQTVSMLVAFGVGLPFLYFLYKVALFVFFMRSYARNRRESGDEVPADVKPEAANDESDGEANRPTAYDSSSSPPTTPTPRQLWTQDRKPPLNSNNSGFWVDEELQAWRLDFQRLKLLKCLTLSANQKRHTLRKQSVTSALHPREIWLASYSASGGGTTISPGGGATNPLVVVKFLPPKEGQLARASVSGAGGGARDKLKGELKRQAMFSHPQVVTFIGVAWSRETHLVAVTEYMAQGDLRQYLHRTARQDAGKWSTRKLQMLLDVARALLYLHSMHPRLVHGNCNSRNVVLDDALRAKLSDFGVDGRAETLSDQELMSYSAVGSGRWISPEAILGRETSAAYPDAGDVYSLGILMAEMDSHDLPFSDLMQANRSAVPETDILQLIAKGALTPTLSPTCPTSIVKLVTKCTSYSPKHRPSSKQVQQDLMRILDDFREFESQTTVTVSNGAPRSHRPSNLV